MIEYFSPLTDDELARIRNSAVPSGYPPYEERLHITRPTLLRMITRRRIVIPDDPRYHMVNQPSRRNPEPGSILDPIATVENPLGPEYRRRWKELGLLYDTADRPLHPRALELFPTIRMCTGVADYHRYGPQNVGNLALRRERNGVVEYAAVAVKRGGRVRWGLPGGYAEPGESPEDAALREAEEEATVKMRTELERRALGHFTITGRQARIRCTPIDTAHAWMVEHYIYVRSFDNPALEGVTLEVGIDPAVIAVHWINTHIIHNSDAFLSSHRNMIETHEESLA